MRALTVMPGRANSARLEEVPEPAEDDGSVLVESLALGLSGLDIDIVEGHVGCAPPGKTRLIFGHESLGRVISAPAGCGLERGDLVVGIVRRPDPVPCANCASGEWDMCRNGQFTETGIKARDGFGADRFRIEPEFAVRVPEELECVGALVEPASLLAKAWEHVEKIGKRSKWAPLEVLVTGAGPIGLLAALMGLQRGLEVHVLDRLPRGPKPDLVRDLGASYHHGAVEDACPDADIVFECTGVGRVAQDAIENMAADGIMCLAGVCSGARTFDVDASAVDRSLMLQNEVIFSAVSANRRHYHAAVEALSAANREWLERLITRRVPLACWSDALERQPEDVKPIVDFTL